MLIDLSNALSVVDVVDVHVSIVRKEHDVVIGAGVYLMIQSDLSDVGLDYLGDLSYFLA